MCMRTPRWQAKETPSSPLLSFQSQEMWVFIILRFSSSPPLALQLINTFLSEKHVCKVGFQSHGFRVINPTAQELIKSPQQKVELTFFENLECFESKKTSNMCKVKTEKRGRWVMANEMNERICERISKSRDFQTVGSGPPKRPFPLHFKP